jgi:FAD/FMN-containing dehydrogenase
MKPISSWGRLDAKPHHEIYLNDPRTVPSCISKSAPGIAYGNGRSYGDVCLNPNGNIWLTTGLNHFIDFNQNTGVLKCEAGLLLKDIQDLTGPRGWMLAVTPGTQLVTVGGAIANDVHGKNHHTHGSFGHHIISIELARTNGEVLECSPKINTEMFSATIGGLGLTGVITKVSFQLKRVSSPWIVSETIPFYSLDEFFKISDASELEWEHTVAWVDCLSKGNTRGIFMRANHSDVSENSEKEYKSKKLKFPFEPPISLVNKVSLTAFNQSYFNLHKFRAGKALTHYESFFYPLDNILEWNKMYGPRGFYQYQCVIPMNAGPDAIKKILNEVAKTGDGSFLAVLKTFGEKEPIGMLSFPMKGVTLALDFPNFGERTHKLFDRFNSIVLDNGGRIYAAKDAQMPRHIFEAGYPKLNNFINYRDAGISSSLSRRLMGN